MALAAELTSFYDNVLRSAPPPVAEAFQSTAKDHEAEFKPEAAVKIGDSLPEFIGLDEGGKIVTKEELLAKGPVLMVFHRGGWCPLCNIEMRALQQSVQQFRGQGVALVMVSPDPPQESLARKENMKLDFLMLSDPNNELASKLGIVARLPETLRPAISSMNSRFSEPKQSLKVPLSSSLLIDSRGIIRQVSINPRYPNRLEPATALDWIKQMNKQQRASSWNGKGDSHANVIELTRASSGYGWPV